MKYIVIVGDGMADYPVPALGNKTPLQYAKKPNMDYLAKNGVTGLVKTIPNGIAPGSDVANLSVMGYDPKIYYTGRSPLEAVSMGIKLSETDVTFRCNLVTLSDEPEYDEKTMIDYSSDEITTDEAKELIAAIAERFNNKAIAFYPGISYRHCMVWHNAPFDFKLTPPHDIQEKRIADFLPEGQNSEVLLQMMKESHLILKSHPVNISRIKKGLRPANSIWLWGEGKKPSLPGFHEKYRIKGSVISAVDLIKGIGICAGLDSIDVKGATGNMHTNFEGKAEAALNELQRGQDFVFVHIEAPDECGHRNELENKIKSIELIDEKVLGTILKGLEIFEDYSIMLLPDHPTPLSLRTHTPDPVPFVIYRKSRAANSGIENYNEITSGKTGLFIEEGFRLMDMFIRGTL